MITYINFFVVAQYTGTRSELVWAEGWKQLDIVTVHYSLSGALGDVRVKPEVRSSCR